MRVGNQMEQQEASIAPSNPPERRFDWRDRRPVS